MNAIIHHALRFQNATGGNLDAANASIGVLHDDWDPLAPNNNDYNNTDGDGDGDVDASFLVDDLDEGQDEFVDESGDTGDESKHSREKSMFGKASTRFGKAAAGMTKLLRRNSTLNDDAASLAMAKRNLSDVNEESPVPLKKATTMSSSSSSTLTPGVSATQTPPPSSRKRGLSRAFTSPPSSGGIGDSKPKSASEGAKGKSTRSFFSKYISGSSSGSGNGEGSGAATPEASLSPPPPSGKAK
jgi:hypothetical protein